MDVFLSLNLYSCLWQSHLIFFGLLVQFTLKKYVKEGRKNVFFFKYVEIFFF